MRFWIDCENRADERPPPIPVTDIIPSRLDESADTFSIGTLAFGESDVEAVMRLGVLVGSALSAIVGSAVLALPPEWRPKRR